MRSPVREGGSLLAAIRVLMKLHNCSFKGSQLRLSFSNTNNFGPAKPDFQPRDICGSPGRNGPQSHEAAESDK